jgi:hypothetical protein
MATPEILVHSSLDLGIFYNTLHDDEDYLWVIGIALDAG